MKRQRDEDHYKTQPTKILRVVIQDRISKLSDELLLRILSYASVSTLLTCQRVSTRFSRIAVDSELWKAAYYKRFVLPRAAQIPGIKSAGPSDLLCYSSKLSKWLDEENLVKKGPETNWKQQYRLRHNWSLGQCAISEIIIADNLPDPPLLVMMHEGLIFTADSIAGLRAWDPKGEQDLIASTTLAEGDENVPKLPTSMAIDAEESGNAQYRVAIGFQDGSFSVYALNMDSKAFVVLFDHPSSSNGMLSAIAYCSPYLLTMTHDQLLTLYAFKGGMVNGVLEPPRLLYSLRSHTVWPPVSLSIRTSATSVTAAIAYALPTYLSGWTVGLQEMRLSHEGGLMESRLATAAEHNFRSLVGQHSMSTPTTRAPSPSPACREPRLVGPSTAKPTSLSYSHPYLLVSYPDNTLTLYLVRSTSSALTIGAGSRLWGHTSSVSGAHVGMRGKAVSVSRLGDELRVWDLEGGMVSLAKKRTLHNSLSVRVQTAKSSVDPSGFSLRTALEQRFDDSTVSQGWVGFDEQNVIVLREKSQGSQALVVHDFT